MGVSYRHFKRYKEIAYVLVKYGFSFVIEKLNLDGIAYKIPIFETSKDVKKMTVGERLKRAFEELGPTYIKIGQILSMRKDLLDQDILDELSKLRDDTDRFPTEEAIKIFESELGKKIEDTFVYFNEKPIAAASIGQVYEAKLSSDEHVIVKIQRPNIEKTIKADLHILKSVITAFKDFKKEFNIEIGNVLEEFETQLIRELDYRYESISASKFKVMFKNSKEVYIPYVYQNLTTKRVLVMEKINGIKLSDISKIKKLGWDTKKIADIGVRSFILQVLYDGFFHADPHPGNIFVLGRSRIAYIDFGMIGIIDRKTLKLLNDISIAIIDKNVDKIIDILIEMNALSSDANLTGFREDMLYLLHFYYDIKINRISATDIINEIFRFLRKYKVVLPTQLVLLAKTFMTLEGTARLLNPDFTVKSMSGEFIKYYYTQKLNIKEIFGDTRQSLDEVYFDLKTMPKHIKSMIRNIERNNLKINIEDVKMYRLESIIMELTNKLSLSLILASIVIGSSLILASPNIYNNRGIRYTALAGFLISFIIGIFLVIKSFRSRHKKD